MVQATAVMAPDSTMRYIEDAYRLVEVAVKEAIDRPIHQKRATIAPVTEKLRASPNAHPDIMREVVTEPYNPSFGGVVTAEDAYAVPDKTSVSTSNTMGSSRTYATSY